MLHRIKLKHTVLSCKSLATTTTGILPELKMSEDVGVWLKLRVRIVSPSGEMQLPLGWSLAAVS